LITTNYVEDRRLSAITTTGDGTKVLSNDGTYKILPTKISQLENDSNFLTEHQSLENYVTKADAFSGDFNDLTNAPIGKDNLGDLVETDSGKKIATEEYVVEQLATISVEAPGEYASIVLKSSTEGSTKKFRLTIDDEGTITAEEVTE
jgi:hypothetical protein